MQWLNSTGHVVSNNETLMFSLLPTSDGGEYTCNVTIIITELDIAVTGVGNSILRVQSKYLVVCSHCTVTMHCPTLSGDVQFLLQLLLLKQLVNHLMALCTLSHAL